jgi:hypothetical protein
MTLIVYAVFGRSLDCGGRVAKSRSMIERKHFTGWILKYGCRVHIQGVHVQRTGNKSCFSVYLASWLCVKVLFKYASVYNGVLRVWSYMFVHESDNLWQTEFVLHHQYCECCRSANHFQVSTRTTSRRFGHWPLNAEYGRGYRNEEGSALCSQWNYVFRGTRMMIYFITYCKIILHFDLHNNNGWCLLHYYVK